MKKSICPKCGKTYRMGYNGIKAGCDDCNQVQRDEQGYAWTPGEMAKLDHDGNPVVMRPENLGGGKR